MALLIFSDHNKTMTKHKLNKSCTKSQIYFLKLQTKNVCNLQRTDQVLYPSISFSPTTKQANPDNA